MGVFVHLRLFGETRGSAGLLLRPGEGVGAAVAQLAVAAATADERFTAVTAPEAPLLSYAVDLLIDEPSAPPGAVLVEAERGQRPALLLLADFMASSAVGVGRSAVEQARAAAVAAARAEAGIPAGAEARVRWLSVRHLAEPDFDRRRPIQDDDDESEPDA